MAVPAQLFDQIMRLPEPDRLDLIEHVVAASVDAERVEPVRNADADRAALETVLDESERDVAAGRTRPVGALLAELKSRC